MPKRMLALVLALLTLSSAAMAQESGGAIATYIMPDGAQMCFITESDDWAVPEGLEGMYQLMRTATLKGDIYLLRMQHGRALASVSCSLVESPRTAQQLLELWPQIAQGIAREAETVNDDASCAAVETLYGREVLHIRTEIAAGSPQVTPMDAEGFAFCRGREMIEVWTIAPKAAVYLYDEEAAAQLESDRADLEAFLGSLDFSGTIGTLKGSESYDDPEGRFSLQIPQNALILTPASAEAELAAARERFTAANAAGAERIFDEWVRDLQEQNVTLFLLEDMKAAVQVFCSPEPDFADVTNEMLCSLAQPMQKTMQERYGTAVLLTAADGGWMLSGHEQAALSYWLRSGECDLQLDILACVLGEDWLCEVDVYTIDGDPDLREALNLLLAYGLEYHVE